MRIQDKSILVVEDVTTDARLIERSMKKAKVCNPLIFVSDGEMAIEYLAQRVKSSDTGFGLPVLILLDLKLPKKDGFEVLNWIKQQPVLRRIPIVVLTSSSLSPDINRAYDLGANSYLVKPVENDALIEMFRKLDVYWLLLNEPPRNEMDGTE